MNQFEKRHMILEAEKYIASDKTDPFLRDRIMCHINNGIAQPGDYTAELSHDDDGRPLYTSRKRV